MAQCHQDLKRFLYEHLYRHYRVVRMQVKAENTISSLFGAYQRAPEQLPDEIQQRAQATGHLSRVICDYIAGMTDRFALDEYAKLFDPHTLP